jgi:phosphoglycolate phosphatase-like HAD superfamily hydrolase
MHVCLFDIDGTLIASGGAGKSALEAGLAEEFGIRRPIETLQLSGRTDLAIVRDLLAMHGLEDTPEMRRRVIEAYLRHLPDCLKRSNGQVLPGIAALLERLSGRADVKLGLLTGNLREGARLKLGHFGLFEHFAFGGYGDHHLDRDDVARAALAEARRVLDGEVCPGRVWVIGDTPLDVRCARAIGAKAVAVLTGWHCREELEGCCPDLLLADLSDPAPLWECWGECG